MVHLAPTKQTYRARDIAEVMFNLIYKLHGMPSNIVSDRDSLFTSTFWQKLHELTGVELRMSTSFHPQSDGATERANRTITQMLRQCVSPHQRDWAIKLPAIEFAINSARSSTTGYAPFYLNYGRLPPSMIWDAESKYPGVRVFAQLMKDAVMSAHDAIIAARVKQTSLANRRRKEAPFVIGDLVYLSTENLSLPKGRARKLAPKFIGPYRIIEDYKNNSYMLDLPPELKQRGVHPSFHANLLRMHEPNDDRRFPGRQLQQISDLGRLEEWSVSRVTDHHGAGTDALFEIEYTTGDKVWLPYHEVSRLEAVGQYLEALGVPSIKHLPRKVSAIQSSAINVALESDSYSVSEYIDAVITGLVRDFSVQTILKDQPHDSSAASRHSNIAPQMPRRASDPTRIALFKEFARRITSGSYDSNTDDRDIPHGYFEYCWSVRDHEDPAERLPMPPHLTFTQPSPAPGFASSPPVRADERRLSSFDADKRGYRRDSSRNDVRQARREARQATQLLQQSLQADIMARQLASRRAEYEFERQIEHDRRRDAAKRRDRERHHAPRNTRAPRFGNRSIDNRRGPPMPPVVRRTPTPATDHFAGSKAVPMTQGFRWSEDISMSDFGGSDGLTFTDLPSSTSSPRDSTTNSPSNDALDPVAQVVATLSGSNNLDEIMTEPASSSQDAPATSESNSHIHQHVPLESSTDHSALSRDVQQLSLTG